MQPRYVIVNLLLSIVLIGVLIYDTFTLVFYLSWQRPWRKWRHFFRSRSTREWTSSDEHSVVQVSVKQLPEHFLCECKTINEALDRAIQVHGEHALCTGYREVTASEEAMVEGRLVNKCALTDYKWHTFGQFYELRDRFAHGLRQLGIAQGDKVMIFAETCINWFICGQAIIKNGSVLVTLYSSLGDQGIVHGIVETEVVHIITSSVLAQKLVRLRQSLSSLKHIILLDSATDEQMTKLKKQLNPANVTLLSDLVQSANDIGDKTVVDVHEDDVAIIMYTSGTNEERERERAAVSNDCDYCS